MTKKIGFRRKIMQIIESSISFLEQRNTTLSTNMGNSITLSPNGQNPLVSVIVPNFNYDRYIEVCIRSILNSSLQNIEIILVDSSDQKFREMKLKSILGDLVKDSRLRIYFREEKKLGDNRNFGISKSRSDFVCSIDPDDIIHPHYLLTMLFRAEMYGLDISGSGMNAFEQINETWHVKRKVSFLNLSMRNELASNSLFRKNLWNEIGGFVDSTGKPHIHEDWRFWHRASKSGFRIGNVDRPLTCIRVHGKNMSWQPDILSPSEQIEYIRSFNKDVSLSVLFRKKFVDSLKNLIKLFNLKNWRSATNKQNHLAPLQRVSLFDFLSQSSLGIKTVVLSTKMEAQICSLGYGINQYIHLGSILEESEWSDFYKYLILRNIFEIIQLEKD